MQLGKQLREQLINKLSKKKFWLVYLTCCFVGLFCIIFAGCSQKEQKTMASLPRTPEEAGIVVLDSSNCESCHLNSEMISSFEKPKTNAPVVSEGG